MADLASVTPKSSTMDPPCMERRNLACTDEIALVECEKVENSENLERDNIVEEMFGNGEEPKWWEGESQILLDSQQLVEGLSLCDELLQSQSPDTEKSTIPYTLSWDPKDLEEYQNLILDPGNIELDTPPDFRLRQLESFTAWGGKMVD